MGSLVFDKWGLQNQHIHANDVNVIMLVEEPPLSHNAIISLPVMILVRGKVPFDVT